MPDTSFHTIVWKKTAAARPGSVLLLLHYIAYSINLEWLLSSASIPPCANLESPTVCIVGFAKTPTTKLHSIELLGIHSSRVGGTLYRNGEFVYCTKLQASSRKKNEKRESFSLWLVRRNVAPAVPAAASPQSGARNARRRCHTSLLLVFGNCKS